MVIFTDNGADLTQEYLDKNNVKCLNLSVVIDGKEYANLEEAGISGVKGFYSYLRNGGKASTSQVNVQSFYDGFKKELEAGQDVLYVGLSRGLSGCYDSAMAAVKMLDNEFTDNKVYVCDTLSASLGEGLFVDYAVTMRDEGKSAKEIYEFSKENALRFVHWFTVDDLKFLARGGRISSSSAMIGSLIKIKPVMNVDENGKLIPREKVRGRRSAIQSLANHMFDTCRKGDQKVFISHGDCLEEAESLRDIIKAKLGLANENFFINLIGPVIGAHSGPGTIALFYYGEERYYHGR